MRLLRRLSHLFKSRRIARELAEELETHRSLLEAEHMARGHNADVAKNLARRNLGNTTSATEDSRAVWILPWMESIWQDLRFAARSLRAQPGFTTMAFLALILGIGLNTSLFTVINAVMFRGWDVPDSDRVVRIQTRTDRVAGVSVRGAQYLAEHAKSFVGSFVERSMVMRLDGHTAGRTVDFVSGTYFQALQLRMKIGRGFTQDEDRDADPKTVVVLSHSLWQAQFASDPAIIGRLVKLDDVPFTVVGVAPEDFNGTAQLGTEMWVPLQALRLARPNDPFPKDLLTDPDWCCSSMAARLAPGVTKEAAQSEANGIYNQFLQDSKIKPVEVLLTSTALLGPGDRGDIEVAWIITGGFASVLLLACANVSNLLLARSAARRQEFGIRAAIGAGHGRLVRQLMTESLLLAVVASAAGLALAYVLPGPIIRALEAEGIPRLTPDTNVFVYAMGIGVASALLFGLTPSLTSTRTVSMQPGARATSRFPIRSLLLGVQVAISVVLLISAGLLIRGISSAYRLDLGFRAEGISALTIGLPSNRYPDARQIEFSNDLERRLQAMNGGEPVALATLTPLGESTSATDFRIASDAPEHRRQALAQWVTPSYFDVLQIPVIAGRNLGPNERLGEAIVVNETLAHLFWQGVNPVGQTVKIGQFSPTVVGVVRDSKVYGLGAVQPTYFAPYFTDLHWAQPVALIPTDLASSASKLVREMEPLAATKVITLHEQLDRKLGQSRAGVKAATAVGLLALLLASIGVYGVISYSVEQRGKEIGIRRALGAQSSQVVALVLRRNSRAILAGLIVGLLMAIVVSKVIESQLYGVSRLDPIAYLGVLTILMLAGAAASIAPSWRVARTDPARVLHCD